MRDEYNLAEVDERRNPYSRRLTKQVTLRLGEVVEYFKKMAVETGPPYQNTINLYRRDFVVRGRTLAMNEA